MHHGICLGKRTIEPPPGTSPRWTSVSPSTTIVVTGATGLLVGAWLFLVHANLRLGYGRIGHWLLVCTILLALTFVGIKSYEYRDKFMHYEVWKTDGTRLTTNNPNQVTSSNFGFLNVMYNPVGDQWTDGLDLGTSYQFNTARVGFFNLGGDANVPFNFRARTSP